MVADGLMRASESARKPMGDTVPVRGKRRGP